MHSVSSQLSGTVFSTNGKVCPQVTLKEKMKRWHRLPALTQTQWNAALLRPTVWPRAPPAPYDGNITFYPSFVCLACALHSSGRTSLLIHISTQCPAQWNICQNFVRASKHYCITDNKPLAKFLKEQPFSSMLPLWVDVCLHLQS